MKLTDTAYGQEISPMPRTFAYVRVSVPEITSSQTGLNQHVHVVGSDLPFLVVGKTAMGQSSLTPTGIEKSNAIIFVCKYAAAASTARRFVTKLDRLGRNAIDVATTVARAG
jgi:4-diphosphocytidyl-2C-methyl-D-erythritol kinase